MDPQTASFLTILHTALSGKTNSLTDPDWAKLMAMAKRHQVIPLLQEGCCYYDIFFQASDDIRQKLLYESVTRITQQAERTEAFLKLYEKFTSAGLKPLVLKGLTCRILYGELEDHRSSNDEDIYIKKEEFQRYRKVLEENGFLMEEISITDQLLSNIQEVSFYNENALNIEVHLNLMGIKNSLYIKMNSFFEKAFHSCISFDVNGLQIYTMNPTDNFLFLFFHLYKHFISAGVGIRQVLDILLFGRRYFNEIDWAAAEQRIYSVSADRLYADLLEIGRKYFGFTLNTTFQGCCADILLEDIIESGVFGHSTREHKISGQFTAAALSENPSGTISMLFPGKAFFTDRYPEILKKPFILPHLWIKRWVKFMKYDSKWKLFLESIRIGKRRLRLLKEYGII